MNVSIELDDEVRQTYAVFIDGVCIARSRQRPKQIGFGCKPRTDG